jgi:hypothetical protein
MCLDDLPVLAIVFPSHLIAPRISRSATGNYFEFPQLRVRPINTKREA